MQVGGGWRRQPGRLRGERESGKRKPPSRFPGVGAGHDGDLGGTQDKARVTIVRTELNGMCMGGRGPTVQGGNPIRTAVRPPPPPAPRQPGSKPHRTRCVPWTQSVHNKHSGTEHRHRVQTGQTLCVKYALCTLRTDEICNNP